MLKGFKEFIARGNVVEMAVGIIIGGAFKNIVDALVNGVINPLIAASVGKPDFSKAFIVTFHGTDITFGVLLTAVINFLIMAFALYFFLVLPMNYLAKRTKKAEDEAPKEVSEEVQLLTEIRDALAKGGGRCAAAPPCCIPAVLRDDAPLISHAIRRPELSATPTNVEIATPIFQSMKS